MLEAAKQALAWLSAIDPALPRALLVATVMLLVLLIRKLFPRAWELFARAVPVPVIDPAPLLLLLSKTWQALPAAAIGAGLMAYESGGDPVVAAKGAVFGALAALAHEVLKAVPWIPYRGAVGKRKPPTLPAPYLFVLATLLSAQPYISGCSQASHQAASADVIEKATALAFNGAVVTLLLLDAQEARHLDSLSLPTPLQIAESELRVKSLGRARDALVIVRRALAGELGDLDEREKLREAVKALDLVAADLEARGVRLPSDLTTALDAARVAL